MEKILTETAEIGDPVERVIDEFEEAYRNALERVLEVKRRRNELESRIVGSERADSKDLNELKSATRDLNTLSDSLILVSTGAWDEYNRLKQECTVDSPESAKLGDLRSLCKKIEGLAADLLCYSLGT